MKPSLNSPFQLALITGATSGLGEALAHFLAQKKIPLILVGRNKEKLEALGEKLRATTFAIDLSNRKQREPLIEHITEKAPDLIINCAGLGFYGKCVDIPIQDQLEMIEVNISALVEISIMAARTLIEAKKGGTILNISSSGAFFNFPAYNIYAASKGFVNQFSETLNIELRENNIHVLCSCPGQISTDFRRRAAKGKPQKTDNRTMTPEQAIRHIWWQIEKKKPLYIFDSRYRWMVRLSKLLPKALLNKILAGSIKKRTHSVQATK